MFGAGCLVLAHTPGPSIKGFHKREGGGAHEGKKQSMCSKTKGMELVHNLGVPSLTWYENQLQTGRSTFNWYGILLQIVRFRFQLIWKSFTIWAFPLPPMENEYKLGVPSFNWYGNHLQTVRTHFQLV